MLDHEDILSLGIGQDEVLASVRQHVTAIGRGETVPVARTVAEVPGGGRFIAFPAIAAPLGVAGIKWLSIGLCGQGPGGSNAHLLVSDAHTGALRAVLDANWITLARTVAITVLAAEVLADPSSRCLGFLGCGRQARAHLQALLARYPVRRVVASGRGRDSLEAFIAYGRTFGVTIESVEAGRCVSEADILVSTASAGNGPPSACFEWLRKGAFVSMVDLGRIWNPAIDTGRFIVDDIAQFDSLAASGAVARFANEAAALPAIMVEGRPSAWRNQGPAIFLPTGLGSADLAIGVMVLDRADARLKPVISRDREG